MRDLFKEITSSLKRNKMRTALTGFAVSWGIFMIIALLGAGNGLLNALLSNDSDNLVSTMEVWGMETTKPYDGLKEGRPIDLDQRDVELTGNAVFADVVDDIAPIISNGAVLTLGKEYANGTLVGVYPEYAKMQKIRIQYGRMLNDLDLEEKRKNVVVPGSIAETLLGKEGHNQELVGQTIKAGRVMLKVVGVTKTDKSSNDRECLVPYSMLNTIYAHNDKVDRITFSFHGLPDEESNEAFENRYKRAINSLHRADPTDAGTLYIYNSFVGNIQMHKAINIIQTALWIIGLFTLLSGVVGVSNIMLITVKERTHEFGVRKAIGARPGSILNLIISESIAITAFFGYIGMIFGMLACEIMNVTLARKTLSLMDMELNIFKDPFVGVDVAIEATVVLIVAGIIAGLIPAVKASRVRPIEALREG